MGIGVYQARDYVQALGGNLTVESTKDEGTTFTISLPVTAS
jgi:signal transduction histidine kinase